MPLLLANGSEPAGWNSGLTKPSAGDGAGHRRDGVRVATDEHRLVYDLLIRVRMAEGAVNGHRYSLESGDARAECGGHLAAGCAVRKTSLDTVYCLLVFRCVLQQIR